ncbi:hypothetical protein YTPLAS18_20340 [Nitrospira sp.]|nr:hypothetical protein YTPLAS18_20340 [Nitrospira sp.]
MIRSMTGFGRKEVPVTGGTLAIEIRAVNHRFLDVLCRLPKSLSGLEESCKQMIQQHCQRGRVEVSVTLNGERQGPRAVSVDRQLAKLYVSALRALQRELRLSGKVDVNLVAGLRDVVSLTEAPGGDRNIQKTVLRTLTAAVRELTRMREREGDALARDVIAHLVKLDEAHARIAQRAPRIAEDALARLKARVQVLLDSNMVDEIRLHQELAILADRSDISEELARFQSHCAQFRATLERSDSVGKTLDFLLQELGREVNTIGSKANDPGITADVVQMKTELEKIREQVQNIE